MDKILITGGAGFIGSAITRTFLEAGIKVIVYDNFSYGKKEFLPEDDLLTVVEGDLNDTDLLKKTISEYTPAYVCHMAAMHFIPHCNANPTKALMTNTVGTESVLEACKNQKVKKVLTASTAAVYPANDLPNNEEKTKADPIDIYGLSKLFTEYLARKFYHETGIDTIVLRIFNAVGPRETNPHVIPHIFESLKTTDTISLGNIEPKRDYIHTSDLAGAVYALCNSKVKGHDIFNVGTGKEYSVEEIVSMISSIINRPLNIKQDPDRIRKVERMHLSADISKIKAVAGWEPKFTIQDSLKDTARYYGILKD